MLSLKPFQCSCSLTCSLGKEPLKKAFELIDYLKEESSTAPLSQALFQLGLIFGLLEKRGEQQLAARVMVCPSFLLIVV